VTFGDSRVRGRASCAFSASETLLMKAGTLGTSGTLQAKAGHTWREWHNLAWQDQTMGDFNAVQSCTCHRLFVRHWSGTSSSAVPGGLARLCRRTTPTNPDGAEQRVDHASGAGREQTVPPASCG